MCILQQQFGERFVAYRINYKHVCLAAYEVQSLEEASHLEALHAAARREAYLARKAAEFAKGAEAPARRRAPRKQAPKATTAKPVVAGADSAAASDDSRQEDDDETSDAGGSNSELEAALGFEAAVDHSAALEEAGAAAQQVAQEAGPTYDANTGRVFGPGNVYLGRISLIKPGTPQESLSIYCSRHRCSVCKRASVAPSHQEILRWFAEGESIPRGTQASLQGRHKKLFPSG